MTVEINGTSYPMRATMGAWRKFEQASGVKVAQVSTDDVTRIPELAYYFIQSGCKAAGMKFELSVDDFLDIVEVEDVQAISEAVAKLIGGGQKGQKKSQGAKP
jgi:hypothetical protein